MLMLLLTAYLVAVVLALMFIHVATRGECDECGGGGCGVRKRSSVEQPPITAVVGRVMGFLAPNLPRPTTKFPRRVS